MSGTGESLRVAAVMYTVGIVDLGSVKFSYGLLEMLFILANRTVFWLYACDRGRGGVGSMYPESEEASRSGPPREERRGPPRDERRGYGPARSEGPYALCRHGPYHRSRRCRFAHDPAELRLPLSRQEGGAYDHRQWVCHAHERQGHPGIDVFLGQDMLSVIMYRACL